MKLIAFFNTYLFISGMVLEIFAPHLNILGVAPSNYVWFVFFISSIFSFSKYERKVILCLLGFVYVLPLISMINSLIFYDPASTTLLMKEKLKFNLALSVGLIYGFKYIELLPIKRVYIAFTVLSSIFAIGQSFNIKEFYFFHLLINNLRDLDLTNISARPPGLAPYYLPLSYQLGISYLILAEDDIFENKALKWMTNIIILAGIIIAETRSAWMGIVLGLYFFIYQMPQAKRRLPIKLLISLIICIVVKVSINVDRFSPIFTNLSSLFDNQSEFIMKNKSSVYANEDYNLTVRKWMIISGAYVALDNPWVGIGRNVDNYHLEITRLEKHINMPNEVKNGVLSTYTHNSFLNFTVSEGILIFILTFCFWLMILTNIIKQKTIDSILPISICIFFIINGLLHNSGLLNYSLAQIFLGILFSKTTIIKFRSNS
jgi:hypothetical protein